MKTSLKDTLSRLDALIREGKGARAREALRELAIARPPRELAAELARVLWRAGLPDAGIRVLHAIVRPNERKPAAPATPAELAEYAACLIKAGATEEGLLLLRDVEPRDYPRSILYRAGGLVSQWDYAGSIGPLREYLAMPGLSRYDTLIGKINFAAALVYERDHEKARYALRELLYESSLKRLPLALGRVLELAAEDRIMQGRWKEGERFLEMAEGILGESGSRDLLIVRKFRAIAAFLQAPADRNALAALRQIRDEAAPGVHWETARDCDRIEAVGRKDDALLTHVLFGTPFQKLRERILHDWPRRFEAPTEYLWKVGQGPHSGPTLDLAAGEVEGKKIHLKAGQANHRLLSILSSDFYRWFRAPTIHAQLFPDEFYNPGSSPVRVRQAIRALRRWFEAHRLPFIVDEHAGCYRLWSDGPAAIRLTAAAAPQSRQDALLAKLRETWPDGQFSLGEAGELLGMSPRNVLRALQKGLDSKTIVRSGTSVRTRYGFAK